MDGAFVGLPALERAFASGRLTWTRARLLARVAKPQDAEAGSPTPPRSRRARCAPWTRGRATCCAPRRTRRTRARRRRRRRSSCAARPRCGPSGTGRASGPRAWRATGAGLEGGGACGRGGALRFPTTRRRSSASRPSRQWMRWPPATPGKSASKRRGRVCAGASSGTGSDPRGRERPRPSASARRRNPQTGARPRDPGPKALSRERREPGRARREWQLCAHPRTHCSPRSSRASTRPTPSSSMPGCAELLAAEQQRHAQMGPWLLAVARGRATGTMAATPPRTVTRRRAQRRRGARAVATHGSRAPRRSGASSASSWGFALAGHRSRATARATCSCRELDGRGRSSIVRHAPG